MTLEELTTLTEALTSEFDLSAIRAGKGPALDNEGFVLLVRFLGGERVDPEVARINAIGPMPEPARPPRRERELVELSPEEAAERLAAFEDLEREERAEARRREAPYKVVDLGDGVTLGFGD